MERSLSLMCYLAITPATPPFLLSFFFFFFWWPPLCRSIFNRSSPCLNSEFSCCHAKVEVFLCVPRLAWIGKYTLILRREHTRAAQVCQTNLKQFGARDKCHSAKKICLLLQDLQLFESLMKVVTTGKSWFFPHSLFHTHTFPLSLMHSLTCSREYIL